ncbi:MFS transporter [Nigerium massiliense]|uniref:hypothetical protein n=1 Tax=Nigerium massiliense TaxID=1522317 RepID=UPI00059108BA|nr:hypothetical protein [Nigerium massiliense]
MSIALLRGSAGRIFLIIEAGQAFIWAVAFTLGLVYQIEVAHLDPFQLVLIGTILEASCFLAEIPTGIVADIHSRRLSVIVGIALLGVGVLITAVPLFWTIALGNVVWGVGYTFTSLLHADLVAGRYHE